MIPPVRELLAELIRRPSINPMGRTDIDPSLCHESRITDYLEAQLRTLGVPYLRWEAAPGRANVLATFTPEESTGHILWEAHQDTVPVDGMTVEPFGTTIDTDRMFGRGSCDVKGGGAAMLSAFATLVEMKPSRSAIVTLAFTIDEEHTFLGVQALLAELQRREAKIDLAIVAEPTGLNIVDSHKGVVRRQLETTGVACHSSTPERGKNAVYRMAKLITHIEQYANELRKRPGDVRLGSPSLSVGTIHGGVSSNTVPDHCVIDLDRRLLPGEDPGEAMVELETYLRSVCDVPFTLLPEIFACPALMSCADHPYVKHFGSIIDAVVGQHRLDAVPYGTDASTLALGGIAVVVFGPGDIADAHTKAESIDLNELDQAVQILLQFALR